MSNNLDLIQVAENQNQKEVTINQQSAELDAAFTERFSADMSAGDMVLTNLEFMRHMLFACDGQTASQILTVPAIKRSIFVVSNPGAFEILVQRGTTTFPVAVGALSLFATDGTTNGLERIIAGESSGIYDLQFFISGTPVADELLLRTVTGRAYTIPAAFAGSQSTSEIEASAESIFHFKKNGTEFGTLTYAASSAVGVFAAAGITTFGAGDVLTVNGPILQDPNLENISFTILGSR